MYDNEASTDHPHDDEMILLRQQEESGYKPTTYWKQNRMACKWRDHSSGVDRIRLMMMIIIAAWNLQQFIIKSIVNNGQTDKKIILEEFLE